MPTDTPPAETGNPYQSPPDCGDDLAETLADRLHPVLPTKIQVGDVFWSSWGLFRQNVVHCLAAGAVFSFLHVGAGFVPGLVRDVAPWLLGPPPSPGVVRVEAAFGFLAYGLTAVWLSLGLLVLLLSGARGKGSGFARFFGAARYVGRFLTASLLVGFMSYFAMLVLVGLPLLLMIVVQNALAFLLLSAMALVGAVVSIAIPWGSAWYAAFLVDRDASVSESIDQSIKIIAINKYVTFVMTVPMLLAGCAVIVFTRGIGLTVVAPYWACVYITIYMLASGQPMAVAGAPPAPSDPNDEATAESPFLSGEASEAKAPPDSP